MKTVQVLQAFLLTAPLVVVAWQTLPPRKIGSRLLPLAASTSKNNEAGTTYKPVFDFSKPETVDMIDRLDDAIMGGISTSSVMYVDAHGADNYTKWSGVCRTEGGGFCGFRTNPFREPLQVGDADGIYLIGRLASDEEPERRVWKMSTRTKPDRGEVVYQAPFTFEKKRTWSRIEVPFSEFKLVRGPRQVPDAPSLDTEGGIYQVGMTMSKFAFGVNMTEFENFRPGFFEVQLRDIGFYKSDINLQVETPQVLSKKEAEKQRNLLLKVLFPVAKLFFSEQR
jgi:hypothetical protein